MGDVDLSKHGAAHSLERLLRAASRVDADLAQEMPFGFDTRVIANRGDAGLTNGNGVTRLIRRVALVAAAILVVSGVAAVREIAQARALREPMTNEYALADSAIETEMSR